MATDVKIALETKLGRLIHTFPNSTTLWDLLKFFENNKEIGKGIEITTVGGINESSQEKVYMQPSLLYKPYQKEVDTNDDLRKTTLATIGILKGNGVITLNLRQTSFKYDDYLVLDKEREIESKNEQNNVRNAKLQQAAQDEIDKKAEELKIAEYKRQILLEQNKESSKTSGSTLTINSNNSNNSNNGNHNNQDNKSNKDITEKPKPVVNNNVVDVYTNSTKKSLNTSELTEDEVNKIQKELMDFGKSIRVPVALSMEIEQRELDEIKNKQRKVEEEKMRCDRNIRVLGPPSDKNKKTVSVDNSIYEVTSADLQKAAAEKSKKLDEAQLFMPKSERDKQREKTLSKYNRCNVKIFFPNKYELSGEFLPTEKLSRVFEFIREHLHSDVPSDWHLYTTPPQTILSENNDLSLLQLGYLPAVKIYFEVISTPYSNSYLNDETMSIAVEKVNVVYEFVGGNEKEEKDRVMINEKPVTKVEQTQQKPNDSKQPEKKIPSWFKPGGK